MAAYRAFDEPAFVSDPNDEAMLDGEMTDTAGVTRGPWGCSVAHGSGQCLCCRAVTKKGEKLKNEVSCRVVGVGKGAVAQRMCSSALPWCPLEPTPWSSPMAA